MTGVLFHSQPFFATSTPASLPTDTGRGRDSSEPAGVKPVSSPRSSLTPHLAPSPGPPSLLPRPLLHPPPPPLSLRLSSCTGGLSLSLDQTQSCCPQKVRILHSQKQLHFHFFSFDLLLLFVCLCRQWHETVGSLRPPSQQHLTPPTHAQLTEDPFTVLQCDRRVFRSFPPSLPRSSPLSLSLSLSLLLSSLFSKWQHCIN